MKKKVLMKLLSKKRYLPHASVFLISFLKPQDGSDMFLRNVDWLSAVYTLCIPEDEILEEISISDMG
jgi:hypothetical protein